MGTFIKGGYDIIPTKCIWFENGLLAFFTFKYDKNNVFLKKGRHFSPFNADFLPSQSKNWLSKDIFDFLPPGKGVRLLGQGVQFFGLFSKHAGGTFIRDGYAKFCQKNCKGYVY